MQDSHLLTDSEISTATLIATIVKNRALYFRSLLFFILLGSIICIFIPQKYQATAIATPNKISNEGLPPISALLANPSNGVSERVLVEQLNSNAFKKKFIDNMLQHDFPNENTHTLMHLLTTMLKIRKDFTSGSIKVSFIGSHKLPLVKWANHYVALFNETLQTQAIKESEQRIDYLKQALQSSQLPAIHNIALALMEANFREHMQASTQKEYALKIIDAAFNPLPIPPGKMPMLVVNCFSSLLLSMIVVFIKASLIPSFKKILAEVSLIK